MYAGMHPESSPNFLAAALPVSLRGNMKGNTGNIPPSRKPTHSFQLENPRVKKSHCAEINKTYESANIKRAITGFQLVRWSGRKQCGSNPDGKFPHWDQCSEVRDGNFKIGSLECDEIDVV